MLVYGQFFFFKDANTSKFN